jgi:hypothetical protein
MTKTRLNPAELKPVRELFEAGKLPKTMTLRGALDLCYKGELQNVKVSGRYCTTEEWINEFLLRRMNGARQ